MTASPGNYQAIQLTTTATDVLHTPKQVRKMLGSKKNSNINQVNLFIASDLKWLSFLLNSLQCHNILPTLGGILCLQDSLPFHFCLKQLNDDHCNIIC